MRDAAMEALVMRLSVARADIVFFFRGLARERWTLIAFHAVPQGSKAHVDDATWWYYVPGSDWPAETPVKVVALGGPTACGEYKRASCPLGQTHTTSPAEEQRAGLVGGWARRQPTSSSSLSWCMLDSHPGEAVRSIVEPLASLASAAAHGISLRAALCLH